MARRDDLIASRLDVESIRRHIGADTLGYLSLDGMVRATGGTTDELCTACFTGDYLVPVQLELAKDSLEADPVRA
jgi:amidophosphoribosyltransferase